MTPPGSASRIATDSEPDIDPTVAHSPPTHHAAPPAKRNRFIAAVQRPFNPLIRSFELWSAADGLRMSAAMSFYGILSLAPLLVLMVAVLGFWLDREVLETNLIDQISGLVGAQAAGLLQQAIDSARKPSEGIVASVIAFALLLSGATGVFAELQSAFERLWRHGGADPPKRKWWHGMSLKLRGVGYILALGFLLLVSLVIASALEIVVRWAGRYLPLEPVIFAVNELVAFALCAALFVGMMRMSAGPKPSLRYLVLGAAIGAALFGLGRHLLAAYLSTAAVVSSYGAAGSLVVLLMWLYFSAAVLLYSASCARVMQETANAVAVGRTDKNSPVAAAADRRQIAPTP